MLIKIVIYTLATLLIIWASFCIIIRFIIDGFSGAILTMLFPTLALIALLRAYYLKPNSWQIKIGMLLFACVLAYVTYIFYNQLAKQSWR